VMYGNKMTQSKLADKLGFRKIQTLGDPFWKKEAGRNFFKGCI
jgi:hypothetical protein